MPSCRVPAWYWCGNGCDEVRALAARPDVAWHLTGGRRCASLRAALRWSARGIDGGFDHLGTEAKWFLKGRLVVLYIGVHPGLRAWLVGVLGAAFVDGHAT